MIILCSPTTTPRSRTSFTRWQRTGGGVAGGGEAAHLLLTAHISQPQSSPGLDPPLPACACAAGRGPSHRPEVQLTARRGTLPRCGTGTAAMPAMVLAPLFLSHGGSSARHCHGAAAWYRRHDGAATCRRPVLDLALPLALRQCGGQRALAGGAPCVSAARSRLAPRPRRSRLPACRSPSRNRTRRPRHTSHGLSPTRQGTPPCVAQK